MVKRKTQNRDFIIIIFLTFVVIAVWIGLEVYRSLNTSTVPQVIKSQIQPLNSDFDTETIDALNLRKTVSQSELEQIPLRKLNFAENQISKPSEGSPSAELTINPEGSPAGEID